MIVQGHELTRPLERHAHTVVVGSGAGGAVVARILAEAGVEVVVLEEGGYFRAPDFTQREDEMMAALFRARGFQMTDDGLINVLQGSCFGGSTVINMSDCVPTPPEVYAHWRRLLGLALDERELAASEARVMAALRVNPIQDAQVNRNNATLLEGAERLGLRSGVFRHNRVGCIGSGYCLLGCAYDAKQGAHLTYLPAAVAAGADVYTDARVERIERRAGDGFVVLGSVIERGVRVARLPLRVEAQRVVLAAGAVHSPAILHASGFDRGLPQLGRNLSLQPQMPVVADFPDERPIEPWRGIPQSTYCEEFDDNTAEHGLGGFRLEAVWGGVAQLAASLPGLGDEHKRAMARARYTAMALLLVPDQPSGEITWKYRRERGFVPRIRYRIAEEWKKRLRRGLRNAAEIYFAAGARQVRFANELFPPLSGPDDLRRLEDFPIRSGATRFISAHVQGTCRMSRDARQGVVDERQRLHTLPNVYVVDASVMPTTASTHTMIPIMTFADRAAHRMLED